jgi:ornithine lipid ester-linked acyl 2-hydroxylase
MKTIVQCDDATFLRWVNTLCQSDVQRVPDRPAFYSTECIWWCRHLRHNCHHIQREFYNANTTAPSMGHIMPNQWISVTDVSSDQMSNGTWRLIILRLYRRDTDVPGFPITRCLLCDIPGCTTAFFSILEPGRTLLTHFGVNYGVLRYHLALTVPKEQEQCFLIVGNEKRYWSPGNDILFDDTLPHSASNKSDEVRVVLFLDLLRPLSCAHRARLVEWLHWSIAPHTQYVRSAVRRANEFPKQSIEIS